MDRYPGCVTDSTPAPAPANAKGTLARLLALYTLARLGLVVLIAGLIFGGGTVAGVTVPLPVAALFAVVIALPLSMILFKSLRIRVNEQIAAVDAQRRADREDLRSKLRGEQ